MTRQPSLFRRTAMTVAVGLLVFQLIAGLAMFINLVLPLAHRSADDLAGFLLLSAHVWNELPVEKRPAFEIELREKHGLTLTQPDARLADETGFYPYIRLLRAALSTRLPANHPPRLSEKTHEFLKWSLFKMGKHCDLNFPETVFRRDQARPPPGSLWPVFWQRWVWPGCWRVG